jgi:hypothetical protein
MTSPLLETKLYIPRSRRGLVPRPRLSERLNRGVEAKLTLVSAPAGFGKTTLLAEWLVAAPADEPCTFGTGGPLHGCRYAGWQLSSVSSPFDHGCTCIQPLAPEALDLFEDFRRLIGARIASPSTAGNGNLGRANPNAAGTANSKMRLT